MSGPFHGLEPGYGLIMADPPWAFIARSPKGDGRSASRHYAVMGLAGIKALPVADLAARDAILLLWAIDPMIPQALDVGAAWGFTFKTVGFYWTKRTRRGLPHVGQGYWTRANPEQCLLFTRGRPKRVDASVRRWIDAPVREHSRKPDLAYARAERLAGDVRRLDMFSRQERGGWDAWGLEAGRFDGERDDQT